MMKCSITDLCGEAYREALAEVADVLNSTMGTSFFFTRDWASLDMLAEELGVKFYMDGEIIR